ncbi:MAG: 2-isopropylmalate synthase [Bacteroidetes bacterium 4572_117]|nr:MAG: 2-isopropylmalate synthase [Bacteroidetes bacterium 4572_117]
MDTTLRDGEQTTGVSFNAREKLSIAKILLKDVKVDRIEVASARVSKGEFAAVQKITEWAKENNCINKIEVLGFIDGKNSIDWIYKAGAKVINLLSKGSLKHVREQLNKTPQEHVDDIKKSVDYAKKLGFNINIYLEDWSNGMKNSIDYVFFMIDSLKKLPIDRFMIPDTLGILNHEQTYEFCNLIRKKYPDLHFDFHAHNDYDLATANVFSAIKAGINGIHTTINGLGERAGNVPLSSVIGIVKDHLNVKTRLDESKLTKISNVVESFSGIRVSENKPLIGENVFTQTCGVHADGDTKNSLYFNNLMPERFGRVRKYALGKTSGKANIKKNLDELGLVLDAEALQTLTAKIIELGDRKENVTTEDLPYIIADVFDNGQIDKSIKFKHYSLSIANGLKPVANINIEINGKSYEKSSVGDGQYDAFMKALWQIYDELGKPHPVLEDYAVSIPPGGKTDALVETIITWRYNNNRLKTKGLDPDQTEAAIKATEKMLNIIEQVPVHSRQF